jgi:hypothetical protein
MTPWVLSRVLMWVPSAGTSEEDAGRTDCARQCREGRAERVQGTSCGYAGACMNGKNRERVSHGKLGFMVVGPDRRCVVSVEQCAGVRHEAGRFRRGRPRTCPSRAQGWFRPSSGPRGSRTSRSWPYSSWRGPFSTPSCRGHSR